MAMQVYTARTLRRPDELAALVLAVVQEHPADEMDWIERKFGLDLSARSVQGTLARHILGLVNRQLRAAAPRMQGYGYIVVGRSPAMGSGINSRRSGAAQSGHPKISPFRVTRGLALACAPRSVQCAR